MTNDCHKMANFTYVERRFVMHFLMYNPIEGFLRQLMMFIIGFTKNLHRIVLSYQLFRYSLAQFEL